VTHPASPEPSQPPVIGVRGRPGISAGREALGSRQPIKPSRQQSESGRTANRGPVAGQDCSWVLPLRLSGHKPPLFCACAGGGDAFDYGDLAAALPEDQPVYSFGLPALEDGVDLPTVERIAAAYVKKAREIQKQGPYHLCGHSFGGLVVYEMAALLAQEGEETGLVALLDTEHPAFSRILPFRQRTAFHLTYLFDRLAKYGGNLIHGRIDRIGSDAFALGRAVFKRLAFTVTRTVFRALSREIPAPIRTNELVLCAAWRVYNPPEYKGRVVLFSASDRTPEYKTDGTLGWKNCATGALDLHFVPGDHYTMLHPPLVRDLVARMMPYLGAARADIQVRETQ
jgi:thioesterase domain-containing protein